MVIVGDVAETTRQDTIAYGYFFSSSDMTVFTDGGVVTYLYCWVVALIFVFHPASEDAMLSNTCMTADINTLISSALQIAANPQ